MILKVCIVLQWDVEAWKVGSKRIEMCDVVQPTKQS